MFRKLRLPFFLTLVTFTTVKGQNLQEYLPGLIEKAEQLEDKPMRPSLLDSIGMGYALIIKHELIDTNAMGTRRYRNLPAQLLNALYELGLDLAYHNYTSGSPDSAYAYFSVAADAAYANNRIPEWAAANTQGAIMLYNANRPDDAQTILETQQEFIEAHASRWNQKDYELADLYTSTSAIGVNLIHEDSLNQEIDRLLKIVERHTSYPGNEKFRASFYAEAAHAKAKAKNYGDAVQLMAKSMSYANNAYDSVALGYFLSHIHYLQGAYDKSLTSTKFFTDLAIKYQFNELLAGLKRQAILIYEAQENYEKALNAFLYKDSLSRFHLNERKNNYNSATALLREKINLENHLNAEIKEEIRSNNVFYAVTLILLLVLGTIAIGAYRNLIEKRNSALVSEKIALVEENYVKFSSDYNLILSQYDAFYQEAKAKGMADSPELRRFNSLVNQVRSANNYLPDYTKLDNDLLFLNKLKALDSNLSAKEIKLASTLRYCEGDEEAAAHLNTSLAALRKAKSRLNKKLFPKEKEHISVLLKSL